MDFLIEFETTSEENIAQVRFVEDLFYIEKDNYEIDICLSAFPIALN